MGVSGLRHMNAAARRLIHQGTHRLGSHVRWDRVRGQWSVRTHQAAHSHLTLAVVSDFAGLAQTRGDR